VKERVKKNASGVVPMEKRRTYKSSTRCGCPFRITFSWVDSRNKDNTAVRVNGSCHFKHDNLCLPSRGQLTVEKRKAGTYTKAINENQIKYILLLLNTNNKIHLKTMRDLIRPLFPLGHYLDSQFLFNFLLKAKGIIESRPEEVCDMTITRADETDLLNVTSLDAQYQEYFTQAFRLFNDLVHEALKDDHDILQIEKYLNLLAESDSSFKGRRVSDANGLPTGYMWQTGVHRNDLKLYGSTLFVDRLGHPLNNKGWPLMTIAMLSGEKKVCVACDAIIISERVDGYAWLIKACVEQTPGFELTDIKVIYADGFHAGETLLHLLGIKKTCRIILDHQHLLSGDIGSWPNFFGLNA
jgi:hypothetical protein